MLSLSLEAPDQEVDSTRRRNLVVRKGLRFIVSSILFVSGTASALFITYTWSIPSTIIDLRVVTVFSIVPLLAGLFGAYAFFWKKANLNRISTLNVLSLFAFNLLLCGYCIYLISIL
jgi:hypothetical protein